MLFELNKIKKQFGDRTVLDLPYLSFEARKVYALIGANGAGKTTLLNHLAFLDQPTSGQMAFRREQVKYDRRSLNRLRRQVVLVDQTPILFSGTVFKNVEFGLSVRGVPKKERAGKISAALEQVGMSEFLLSDIHGLSGGEVKRVALARALAVEPDVLLCDEPTANVDHKHQEIILKILQHANSVRNTSVIFSTHYLSQSRRLADYTILLQNGRLSNEMGENSFAATVIENKIGGYVLKLSDNCRIRLREEMSGKNISGKVRIQLVPENIRLHPITGDDRRGCTGKVTHIGIEGNRVRVIVDMGIVVAVSLNLTEYRQKPPIVGQTMRVEFPADAVIVC